MTTRDHVTGANESNGLRLLSTTTPRRERIRRDPDFSSAAVGPDAVDISMDDVHLDPPVAIARSRSVRVVLAVREEILRREVLDFLGRHPGVDLAGAVSTPEALARLIDAGGPSAVVVCPKTAARAPERFTAPTTTLLVVTEDMTVGVLRDAIRVGAQGVFEWPADRAELVETLRRVGSIGGGTSADRGMVVAIAGARGGAGATFVASHLAAAFAARGRRPVLVDADPRHADLTAALGITPDEDARTVQDLVPVIHELSPEHVEDALHPHSGGFRILLGPREADPEVRLGVYRGVVALLSFEYDPVVLHAARADEPSARALIDLADVVVLVTTLDLFSLYGAKRLIGSLGLGDRPERCVVVVNRYGRSAIGPKDVHRVLGVAPSARIRSDRRIRRFQDRGRLLPARAGGAARDIRRLAGHLLRTEPATRSAGQS